MLTDILALITMMFWALVPLFWIPVHGLPGFFKKLGIFTYLTPLFTWTPAAYAIYINREFLLSYRLDLPLVIKLTGWTIFGLGILLQLWTLRLLGGARITGLAEVTTSIENRVITAGPFSVIRHPTYVSHTIMFAGVFLITGLPALGVITLLDIVIINLLVIPLEDRELIERLGDEYRRYKNRVPAYFPRISG